MASKDACASVAISLAVSHTERMFALSVHIEKCYFLKASIHKPMITEVISVKLW